LVSNPSIEVSGVRKSYGRTVALDGMSFIVPGGQVTGFIGPNGAGKSTTMRVILGLDAPDEGEALVLGQRYVQLRRPLTKVGALLDAGALSPSRSGRNHLLWLAHSQRLSADRVDSVTDLVGLRQAARRKAGGYSLGMRQRLGIAAAMLGDPAVLIFDEPFNGMDPEGVLWLRGFLRSLAADGRVVLVSSHLMSEVQDIADHVIVVGRGRVLADASVVDLLAAASAGDVLVRTGEAARATEALNGTGTGTGVRVLGPDSLRVTGLAPRQIVTILTDAQLPFSEVTAQRATLEDVYLQLTRSQVDYRAGSDEAGAR
jgi:ABC-2 type transport system ATP-binding protein